MHRYFKTHRHKNKIKNVVRQAHYKKIKEKDPDILKL